jgi:hypothetical protein
MTLRLPTRNREDFGLTVFRVNNRARVRSALSAGGVVCPTREPWTELLPTTVPFWLKLVSIFSLFMVTTFNERSHMLTIPLTLAPAPLRC